VHSWLIVYKCYCNNDNDTVVQLHGLSTKLGFESFAVVSNLGPVHSLYISPVHIAVWVPDWWIFVQEQSTLCAFNCSVAVCFPEYVETVFDWTGLPRSKAPRSILCSCSDCFLCWLPIEVGAGWCRKKGSYIALIQLLGLLKAVYTLLPGRPVQSNTL
jgi:hypothetical protein